MYRLRLSYACCHRGSDASNRGSSESKQSSNSDADAGLGLGVMNASRAGGIGGLGGASAASRGAKDKDLTNQIEACNGDVEVHAHVYYGRSLLLHYR